MRKRTPLHAASELGHSDIVKLLISHGANVDSKDDQGRLALHLAANGNLRGGSYTEGHVKCLQELIDAGSSINELDRSGNTALRRAVILGHKNAVELLISSGANPDADSNLEKSSRSLIQEKMPEIFETLPPPVSDSTPEEENIEKLLFIYLQDRNLSKFEALLPIANSKGLDLSRIHDGKYTLLQYACDHHGLDDFIIALLKNDKNLDPDAICPGTRWQPVLLAAYQGNSNALRLLVAQSKTDITVTDDCRKETALHKAARMEKSGKEGKHYKECIDILTKAIQAVDNQTPHRKRLDVNAIDALGNTALHYAAQNLDGGSRPVEEIVAALLRAGSYVGIRNKMGEPAISRITPSILENYMNECIGTNGEAPCEEDYEITFDFSMIAPPSNSNVCTGLTEDKDEVCSTIRETEPLSYFCTSKEHQRLLKHPIISSYLFLKWHRIRWIFYGNLMFYSTFVLFLSAYILGTYGSDEEKTDKEKMEWTDVCFMVSSVLLIVLALRELFQLVISPLNYVKSLENVLEIVLIVLTMIMLFSKLEHHVKQHLAAVSILLLWIELVLLVGRHPRLSTYITMFTTVSRNFIIFLTWYSLLIVAFALSFFILFHKGDRTEEEPTKDEEEEKNFFADPGRSVLKTAVMLTGELDFGDLPLDAFQITSHLVFLLFLFLITVVLLNLLNGLAVSDTQAVQDKAELVGYLSRVALVSHVESMMLGTPLNILNMLTRCSRNKRANHTKLALQAENNNNGVGESILIFPELSTIQVLVNRGNKIQPRCCSKKNACNHTCSMDHKIIQAARSIIAQRKHRTEMDDIRLRLDGIEKWVRKISEQLASRKH